MCDTMIRLRNRINRAIYQNVFKPIFFRIDPEKVHDRMTWTGRFLGSSFLTRAITSALFSYSNPKLEQKILGINFPNPVGLGAGFDKDAVLTDILPCVGFGFVEVGSITGEPCEGNPKPRLWRLKNSKGLLVYYGLKNEGCEKISQKLKDKKFKIPVGISVAKTNSKDTVDTKAGIQDYVKAYKSFAKIGSYTTINISCPNAFGGEPFTDTERLDLLLTEIDEIKSSKPIFLKISPDIGLHKVDEIIAVCDRHKVNGFVCTNLTKDRKNPKILDKKFSDKGGMSGKIVEELSNDLIRHVYKKTKGKYVIIGLGGVFNAEDAYKKIKLGASLVQLVTGMIFEGPQSISDINAGLVRLLEKDGYSNISEAIGSEYSDKRSVEEKD